MVRLVLLMTSSRWTRDKMRRGTDLNDDNLRISLGPICRSVINVGLGIGLGLGLGLWTVVYKLLEKMTNLRINHVINIDQWRSVLQIRLAPHFVVSRHTG